MAQLNKDLVEDICNRGSVTEADVIRLRRIVYADNAMAAATASALVRINSTCKVQDPAWVDFFIESLTDYVVAETEPRGYITAGNAQWLLDAITVDGLVKSKSEIELLVNLLDKSRWAPESLVKSALEQVRHAVATGEGPLRSGGDGRQGEITEGEIELLRRILYAFGGDGNVAITRVEAETLFDINDSLDPALLNPAFTDLFVKAIANAVMAASTYAVPSREQALKRESWLEERGDLTLQSIIASLSNGGWSDAFRAQSSEEAALARLERQRIEIITNEAVTQGEVDWLADRLGRDDRMTPNEVALIAFLKIESPQLHPAFDGLVSRMAKAA